MPFTGPTEVAPSTDERELLLRYLQLQRELVVATTTGLDEAGARWTPAGRLIPIIGIVNHLTHVEWRWIDGSYGGQAVSRSEAEFTVETDRTLAEIVDAYFERALATDRTVRDAPSLTVECHAPGLPGIDLRWVLLHLIEETAHHAGHAESTREMLDGSRADW